MGKDYSIGAFKAFLENIGEQPDVNLATARNLKNTSTLLLNSYVDDVIVDESTDIRELGVDEVIKDHFRNAESEPSASTIQVYKSRFVSAREKFLEFTDGIESMSAEKTSRKAAPPRRQRGLGNSVMVLNSEVRGDMETIDVPIPLRPGLILTIPGIPTDLTNEEAERIALILKVYARPQ